VTALAVPRAAALSLRKGAAFGVGAVFGLTLSWSGMTNPAVLRAGLLFRDAYLMLFFASALVTAFIGLRVLKVLQARSVLTGEPLSWSTLRPQRRHVAGSVLFGVGWAVADVCPGPIAAQLGQGVPWALATLAGLVAGLTVFNRRNGATRD
jgi:uncharacterized membrane protein YedE/YeeE